jgi:hypothetical protein
VVGATSPKNVIEVKELQEENALDPMVVTVLGMVTELREEHLLNTRFPMAQTPLSAILTEVRQEQL